MSASTSPTLAFVAKSVPILAAMPAYVPKSDAASTKLQTPTVPVVPQDVLAGWTSAVAEKSAQADVQHVHIPGPPVAALMAAAALEGGAPVVSPLAALAIGLDTSANKGEAAVKVTDPAADAVAIPPPSGRAVFMRQHCVPARGLRGVRGPSRLSSHCLSALRDEDWAGLGPRHHEELLAEQAPRRA